MKKTTILAAVLTVFFASQAVAAPRIPSPALSVPVLRAEMALNSTADEVRKAYRKWKKETDADKIEKEYRKWKKNRSGSSSSRETYRRERRKQQEENSRKSYERWKKRNPDSNKSYKDWKKERDSERETKEYKKWRKKHRRDWEYWRDNSGEDEMPHGEGDGAGSGGSEE